MGSLQGSGGAPGGLRLTLLEIDEIQFFPNQGVSFIYLSINQLLR